MANRNRAAPADHVQPHRDAPLLKRHKLINPSRNLQENICPLHDEVMKVFCRTDQRCICYLCLIYEHRTHETVPVTAERAKKLKELQVRRQQIQQRIQQQEKDVELLQQEEEAINVNANKTMEDSEMIFTQLIRLIHKKSSDVKQQVRSKQETEVSRVKELQEKLKQEITELKRKDAEMEKLSHTEDHNQFLHNYPSVSALSGSPHSSNFNIRPLRYFEDVTAAVSELKQIIQKILWDKWTDISQKVTDVGVLLAEPQPEPMTRGDLLRYVEDITLDPNTTHAYFKLSEDKKNATLMTERQSYPDHPERFTDWHQVLSRESLTGRCYWEIESKSSQVRVAVTYKNIRRAGRSNECLLGCNENSWALSCDRNGYTFWHNNTSTSVSGPRSSKIGVYLDQRAGILSFYSVSGTVTLLHRVRTTFTQQIYAGVFCTCD